MMAQNLDTKHHGGPSRPGKIVADPKVKHREAKAVGISLLRALVGSMGR
ncbi:hypothetical protein [Sorangium sp. So ce341]